MRNVSPEKERAIVDAAETLVASGNDNPTNEAVREQLGRGSIADISPVMRRWRERRQAQTAMRLALPQPIVQAAERFVAQLWDAADNEAGKTIERIEMETSERIAVVEAERDEALNEITTLEETVQRLQHAIETHEGDKNALIAQVEQRRQECQILTLEREKARAQVEAIQEGQAQLIAQLKDAQDNQKALQKELVALARVAKPKNP